MREEKEQLREGQEMGAHMSKAQWSICVNNKTCYFVYNKKHWIWLHVKLMLAGNLTFLIITLKMNIF